ALVVAAHDLGRCAGGHTPVGERAPHDRPRGDGDVVADVRAGQHDHVGAEPATPPDRDGVLLGPLIGDRCVDVGVHVVLVRDVDVRPRGHVVADLDRTVADDVAATTDVAALADADHDVVLDGLARRHPGRQAH